MSERGSGMLDAVAATAVALTIGAVATDLAAALHTLAAVSRDADRLGAARNVLDHLVGAPCASPPSCPPELSCTVSYEPLAGSIPGATRATVTVTPADAPLTAALRLRTAVVAGCG
jgi:hypothetical protein